MSKIYFDVTDIVQYAARNNTVIGIPRVQLNIVTLLARKYGSDTIRCTFFDRDRRAMFEFDPAQLRAGYEFDGTTLLRDLGLAKASRLFPSTAQVKSYLRPFSNNNLLRTLKKVEVYLVAVFMPRRLRRMGIVLSVTTSATNTIQVTRIDRLPIASRYACLGAIWVLPEVWRFAHAHKAQGSVVVQMVHDLIPLSHPHYYTRKEPPAFVAWLTSALDYANRFACVSEWTANNLKNYASSHGYQPVIKATPLAHEFMGFDRVSRVSVSPRIKNFVDTEYVLCVGTIEYRKNDVALLKAWQQLSAELRGALPQLIFAGKYGKGAPLFQELLSSVPQLTKGVTVLHAPTDLELAWLYQNCLFTVFPSESEGWGLPVGESAWFGKLCVASRATSIPEVCGDLIDYVDPTDVGSIAAGIKKPLLDRDYLSDRGAAIAQAKLRSWADVANTIYDFVSASEIAGDTG